MFFNFMKNDYFSKSADRRNNTKIINSTKYIHDNKKLKEGKKLQIIFVLRKQTQP